MGYRGFCLDVVCHVNPSWLWGRGALRLLGDSCRDVADEGCGGGWMAASCSGTDTGQSRSFPHQVPSCG